MRPSTSRFGGAASDARRRTVSAPLAPALHGYRVLDSPRGASDYHGLVVHLDSGLIDTGDQLSDSALAVAAWPFPRTPLADRGPPGRQRAPP